MAWEETHPSAKKGTTAYQHPTDQEFSHAKSKRGAKYNNRSSQRRAQEQTGCIAQGTRCLHPLTRALLLLSAISMVLLVINFSHQVSPAWQPSVLWLGIRLRRPSPGFRHHGGGNVGEESSARTAVPQTSARSMAAARTAAAASASPATAAVAADYVSVLPVAAVSTATVMLMLSQRRLMPLLVPIMMTTLC
eukprot:scpid86755/ scgid10049/ 